MNRSIVFIVLTIGVLIASAAVYVWYSTRSTSYVPASTSQQPILTSAPNAPTAIPLQIANVRGTVSAVSATSLTVNEGAEPKTFPLSDSVDYQQVTAGTFGEAGLQTSKVGRKALQVGQEVYVVSDQQTGSVVSILILR